MKAWETFLRQRYSCSIWVGLLTNFSGFGDRGLLLYRPLVPYDTVVSAIHIYIYAIQEQPSVDRPHFRLLVNRGLQRSHTEMCSRTRDWQTPHVSENVNTLYRCPQFGLQVQVGHEINKLGQNLGCGPLVEGRRTEVRSRVSKASSLKIGKGRALQHIRSV